jgi:hypothetical protein
MSRRAFFSGVAFLCLAVTAGFPVAAQAKTSLRDLARDHGSFFGQRGHHTTLRRIGHSRRYRLTLHGAGERSSFYRDHSMQVRGRADTGKALRQLFKGGSRLGAIEVPGAPAKEDSLAANLSHPTYDRATGTVSYLAEPLAKAPGSGVTPHGLVADEQLPTTLGTADVFVGSSHYGLYCRVELLPGHGEEEGNILRLEWFNVVDEEKAPTDEWGIEPSANTSADAEPGAYKTWVSYGETTKKGCGNAAVLGYTGGISAGTESPEMLFKTVWTGGTPVMECASRYEKWGICAVGGWKTQGLFDTELDATYYVERGTYVVDEENGD